MGRFRGSQGFFAALLGAAAMAYAATGHLVNAAPRAGSLAVQAADSAFRGQYAEAGTLATRSGDPVAKKLVELIYLRDRWKSAGYQRIMSFLDASPHWPLAETLLKRAEYELYADRLPASVVLNHFASRQPLSPEGELALARAELASGNKPAARQLVSRVWINETLDANLERQIKSEFGQLLTAEDHRQRTWQLIYKQETNAAVRAAKA